MTHTPGPWVVLNRGEIHSQPEHLGMHGLVSDFVATTKCSYWAEPFGPKADDNARLIAAAPDMLEALQWIVKNDGGPSGKKAQRALDKAAGAQS